MAFNQIYSVLVGELAWQCSFSSSPTASRCWMRGLNTQSSAKTSRSDSQRRRAERDRTFVRSGSKQHRRGLQVYGEPRGEIETPRGPQHDDSVRYGKTTFLFSSAHHISLFRSPTLSTSPGSQRSSHRVHIPITLRLRSPDDLRPPERTRQTAGHPIHQTSSRFRLQHSLPRHL